ncbi:MAG: hypothetical protein WAV76_09125 [Bacteroidota bacterium]
MTEIEAVAEGVRVSLRTQVLELVYRAVENEFEPMHDERVQILSRYEISEDDRKRMVEIEEHALKILSCSCICAFESGRMVNICISNVDKQFKEIEVAS